MQAVRVAFFTNELTLGGAPRQLAALTRELAPRIEPVVYCMSRRSEPLASELRDAGVEVTVFERRLRWDPLFVRHVTRRLEQDGVHIAHGWQDAANVYAWLSTRPLRLPAVFSLQSDRSTLPRLRRRVMIWMGHRVDAWTVNSRAGYSFLVDTLGVANERVTLLPNWIGVDIEPLNGRAPRPHVIAFVGRLADIKRADLLIDALALLRERGSDARVEICGDGPERAALEARAHNAGLADRVTFHGMLMDVTPVIRRAACVVLPSEFEGLPNTAVEALAAGVPIVARPVGDLPDLAIEGSTGKLFTAAEVGALAPALADALSAVLDDDALAQAARRDGPAMVRERFSIDAAISRLAPIYERLAGTERKTGR